MSKTNKKVITPKTWDKVEHQKNKILTQAEKIAEQQKRILELM